MAKAAIRANIPLYQQTDPKHFPDYEYQEYPKIMKDENGDPVVNNPIYRMTTPRNEADEAQFVLRDGKKIVIGGETVIVNSKEEEDEFYRRHPHLAKAAAERAKVVSLPIGAAALEAENARMRLLLEENEKLKAALADKPARRKPGPKPRLVAEESAPTDLDRAADEQAEAERNGAFDPSLPEDLK